MVAYSAPASQHYSLSLNRPFYASIARRAFGGGVSYGMSRTGAESRRVAEAGANYGAALATSTERTRRVLFGVRTRRARTTGPVPDPSQLTFLELGGDWQELDFITVRRIQNFTRDEDFNLGHGVFPSVAWAPKVRTLGTTESQLAPRVDGGNGNRVASFDAKYFVRGLRYQTFAFHTGFDLGWHLGAADQLALGELNGLRGYGLSEFSGSRRFLFNIEDRIYVYDDLFRVLDVGA